MKTAGKVLKKMDYPGRGIVVGLTPNGENLSIAYFLTGRSENSKNRVLVFKNNRISAKPLKNNIKNQNLVIYDPLVKFKQFVVISNGNHTETIIQGLKKNLNLESSLQTRNFENDPPIYTPRIAAIAEICQNCAKIKNYKFAIIKPATKPKSTERFFFEFAKPLSGQGRLIHTYDLKKHDKTRSFNKVPTLIAIPNNIEVFLKDIWTSLKPSNRISLFVEFLNLRTEKCIRKIINNKP